jgi:hypothetical protein
VKALLAILGGLSILVGVLAFAGVGFTTEKASFDIGPIEGSVREERTLPPAVAGGAIVLGVVLLVVAGRTRAR